MADGESDAEDTCGLVPGVIELLRLVLPTASSECSSESGVQHVFCSPQESSEAREQAACDLCDVTQSEGPASIAVEHSGLQILPSVLIHAIAHRQTRIAELLMGSLANILCHPPLADLVNS